MVKQAVSGSQAVVSALGPTGKPESDQQISLGIANILTTLKEFGIKRFVALSTTSAQDALDQDALDIDSTKFKLRRTMIRKGSPSSYESILNIRT